MPPSKKTLFPYLAELDQNHDLRVWLNNPGFKRSAELPPSAVMTGVWKLNSGSDLEFTVKEVKRSVGDVFRSAAGRTFVFSGKLLAVEAGAAVFEVTMRDERGCAHIRAFRFSGAWGNDEAGRFTFTLNRRRDPDILVLTGSWTVNDNQRIEYTLGKRSLRRGVKYDSTVEFSGFWDIRGGKKLVYLLSSSGNSKFEFKAQVESPTMYPRAGEIRYRLGAGARRAGLRQPGVIVLYGEWKFGRRYGLSFDMEYGEGCVRSLVFGASVDLSRDDTFEFRLRDTTGADPGFSVVFTHRFVKARDAKLFARLIRIKNENKAEAGMTIPF